MQAEPPSNSFLRHATHVMYECTCTNKVDRLGKGTRKRRDFVNFGSACPSVNNTPDRLSTLTYADMSTKQTPAGGYSNLPEPTPATLVLLQHERRK